jgi:hypothetical protein
LFIYLSKLNYIDMRSTILKKEFIKMNQKQYIKFIFLQINKIFIWNIDNFLILYKEKLSNLIYIYDLFVVFYIN